MDQPIFANRQPNQRCYGQLHVHLLMPVSITTLLMKTCLHIFTVPTSILPLRAVQLHIQCSQS